MRKSLHDCPCCTCGQIRLTWSDREAWVDPNDLDAVTQTVVCCALDHAYDRPGDGVPYGLDGKLRDALVEVVTEHLSAVRADWREYTVRMEEPAQAAFRAAVRRVLERE